jgi:hypothetical protein
MKQRLALVVSVGVTGLLAWPPLPVLGAVGGWSPPRMISAPGVAGGSPQVAMGRGGRALAVWEQVEPGGSRVMSATRRANGAWSAPHALTGRGDQPVSDPDLSMNGRGAAVVAWQRGGRIYVVRRTAAGRWSSPRQVSPRGGPAAFPQVAVTAGGRAYVVWVQRHRSRNGVHDRVLVARRPASGPWSRPAVLPSGFGDAMRPQVAVDARNHATVVWQRMWGDGGRTAVLASRWEAGTWSRTRRLSERGQNAGEPVVATNGRGTSLVAWDASRNGRVVIRARTRPAAGPWTRVRTAARGSLGDVALGGRGTAYLTWTRTVRGETRSGVTRRPSGGPWQAGVLLSPTGADATEPRLAVGGGVVTVAWLGGSVRAVRRVGGVWGPPVDLAPGALSEGHQVAMDREGRALVVWKEFDGTADRVVASGHGTG